MPKVFENEIVYNYSPVHTINWLLRKYPNPFATHVFSVDTLERAIDPDTGLLRSERIIGVQQGAPKWITKLFQLPETAYVREVVFVDPDTPSATCMSMNLNLAQYVSCLELITYKPKESPGVTGADAASTVFHQHALLVSQFPTRLVARRIEKASVDRFAANAGIGKQGFEWVLEQGLEYAESLRKRFMDSPEPSHAK
ncbi:Protein UPS2, mitochondrial [Vanrija pseudolonga]|uniref:Protein UPS2, mitochondrial n=1 Tax=Vanrija pseudolonga TaxID=143232 RepID=A0AAF0YFN0_9TREE|nr:Protein UPS2, mitochondrial [Vanrija pseudolonga]